jgi:HPt (histidine-containing phosphotransfer) domain-containing protein
MAKLDKWFPIPHGKDTEHPPIDRNVLAEITGGNANLEHEVLAQFVRANREDAVLVDRAFETRDAALMIHAAHRMKGATHSIGANAVAEVCGRLEAAARAGDWEAVSSNEEAFRREARRLDAYLDSLRVIQE